MQQDVSRSAGSAVGQTEAEKQRPVVGDRLPQLDLPKAPDGTRFVLARMGRESRVLFLSHGIDCDTCLYYLQGLAHQTGELRNWDSSVIAVTLGSLEDANMLYQQVDARLPILADPDGAARSRFGIDNSKAALFVADRYGMVWYADRGAEATELPDMVELEERVRYMALQCPECGVPDNPGLGPWGM